MKTKTIILILTLILCQNVIAQTDDNHGLIIRGNAYNGAVEMHDEYAIWKIKLQMEFVNEGSKPIILINPFTKYDAWKSKVVFFAKERVSRGDMYKGFNSKIEDIIFPHAVKQKSSKEQRLSELAETLNFETPPQNYTNILKPGDILQFDDFIEIKQKITKTESNFYGTIYQFDGPSDDYTEDSRGGLKISEYPNFKIKYSLSLLKQQNNPDLLENLQSRWRSFGLLPVDTKGGFTITSQPIKNLKFEILDKTVKRRGRFPRRN